MNNNQETKCPCIDCITLSMCKSILNGIEATLLDLRQRCKLLSEYLITYKGINETIYHMDRHDETIRYILNTKQKKTKRSKK